MEDLHQEITLCELHTPLAIIDQLLRENHQGVVILMGMTQRSPFQEGRVGSPKTTTPISSSSMTRLRVGSLRDQPLNPQGLLQQIQMWGTLLTL